MFETISFHSFLSITASLPTWELLVCLSVCLPTSLKQFSEQHHHALSCVHSGSHLTETVLNTNKSFTNKKNRRNNKKYDIAFVHIISWTWFCIWKTETKKSTGKIQRKWPWQGHQSSIRGRIGTVVQMSSSTSAYIYSCVHIERHKGSFKHYNCDTFRP